MFLKDLISDFCVFGFLESVQLVHLDRFFVL